MNSSQASHQGASPPVEQQANQAKDHLEKALDEFRAAGKALREELKPKRLFKHHPKAMLIVGGAFGLLLARRLLRSRRKSDESKHSPETIRHAVGRSLFSSIAKAAGSAITARLLWGLAHRKPGRRGAEMQGRGGKPF